MVDVALLLLRILLGALIAAHGLQKAFGWFSGPGMKNVSKTFEGWGFVPGLPFALLAASAEVVGGLLLLSGTATALGAAVVLATLIVAMSPSIRNGFWAVRGGYELPFVYAGIAVVLAVSGPGAISVDALLNIPHNAYVAVAAIVVGVAGAIPPLLRRGWVLRHRVEEPK